MKLIVYKVQNFITRSFYTYSLTSFLSDYTSHGKCIPGTSYSQLNCATLSDLHMAYASGKGMK